MDHIRENRVIWTIVITANHSLTYLLASRVLAHCDLAPYLSRRLLLQIEVNGSKTSLKFSTLRYVTFNSKLLVVLRYTVGYQASKQNSNLFYRIAEFHKL